MALLCILFNTIFFGALAYADTGVVPKCPSELRDILAKYATQMSRQRAVSTSEVWHAYKNDTTGHSPATINLSDACLDHACPILETSDSYPFLPLVGSPSEYENAVLHLRKGDRVVFGNEVFVLGDFLGAGNTTHIFKLQNRPGQAIRIPYVAEELMIPQAAGGITQQHRMNRIRGFVKSYVEAMQQSFGGVKILKVDPLHRFLLVEEVNGRMNGQDFLKGILFDAKTPLAPYAEHVNDEFIDPRFLARDDRKKFHQLFDLMKKNKHARGRRGDFAITVTEARQYIWDEEKARWVLVDAEL